MNRESRKKNKVDWEGLKLAREGKVSLLDQLELDEDDDVFDIVDEDEYAKIVETRRNAGDFVVDDDGIGYYDDGEEHIGVGEDAYETKKRMALAAAEMSDGKLSKKAKKLAEASEGHQKNTMLNFVKPSTAKPVAKPAMSNTNLLDIDSMLENMNNGSESRRNVKQKTTSKPLAPRQKSWKPSWSSYNYLQQDTPLVPMDEIPNQADASIPFDSEPMDQDLNNSYATSTEKKEDSKGYIDNKKFDEDENNVESKASKTEPVYEKISLSTTSKKLKVEDDPVVKSEPIFSNSSDLFSEGWNSSQISSQDTSSSFDPALWLKKEAEGEEYMEFFWTDASENNGIIYLFGKIALEENRADQSEPMMKASAPKYASCCVAVHGVERNLFVLPRRIGEYRADGTEVRAGMKDVYSELTKMLVPNVIPRCQGQGFRCKQVKRNYAFDHGDIPREETEYLKVVYSAKHGLPTPQQCEGGQFIERIFGCGSSPLEWFLLKRKILGPCWLKVRNPRIIPDSISWCKHEIAIESPKFITPITDRKIANPPLTTMTITMKTVVNPVTHIHEIVALAALIHTNVSTDNDTDGNNVKHMKRFVLVRQLGLSCGNDYPSVFPHDISAAAKKVGVVQTLPNERALLSLFSSRLGLEDPDIIVSHNLLGFELEILFSRSIVNKVPQLWGKLGRLRRSKPPKSHLDRDLTAGRILCDTYKSAKEFLRETSYSLSSLASSQLSFNRADIDPIDVPKAFCSSQEIIGLAGHTMNDAHLIQRLLLKLQVIPLTKQLTNLSGNLWSRTMRGARAERIEYLLMHEFHRNKFILPEKKWNNDSKEDVKKTAVDEEDDEEVHVDVGKVGGKGRTRAKAAYAGGLVLEPKKGLYDTYILLLDFNSLYPSIIQEYNLCFTTIDWTKYMEPATASTSIKETNKIKGNKKKSSSGKKSSVSNPVKEEDDNADPEDIDDNDDEVIEVAATGGISKELPPIPDSNIKVGHLPKVIKGLVDRRREVKNLLKKERDPMMRQTLDIRQKALKLTANSMYGCLGFTFSRFYARPIAALVTAKGREALQRTVDLATKQMNLDVIYGDTDSVMINTNSTDLGQVKEIGLQVKKEVNKLYKALELDLDGIFKSMLLLKKKKYAAVTIKEVETPSGLVIQYEKEMKGLDLVRRDWCPLSQETGKYVVDQILSDNTREDIVNNIHDFLRNLSHDIRGGKIDISKFVVTKGLNKNPKDYPDCKGQAHLQVALQMLKANKPVNVGDHIPYVICAQGPEGSTPPQRAHHPDDVIRSDGELTIDYEWYLSNQILPPISRLCEPIDGTSAAIISSHLGLDATKFVKATTNEWLEDGWGFTPKSSMEDSERFYRCKKLSLTCLSCKKESFVPGIISETGNSSGLNCQTCGALYYGRNSPGDCYCYLSNRLTLLVRQCLKTYYDCWLVCDDSSCGRRTQQQSVMGAPLRCTGDCHGRIVQEYDAETLHSQMKYLEYLFDYDRSLRRAKTASNNSNSAEDINRVRQIETVPIDHKKVFNLLKQHMNAIAVKDSAFNWIRPSLFTAVFSNRGITK